MARGKSGGRTVRKRASSHDEASRVASQRPRTRSRASTVDSPSSNVAECVGNLAKKKRFATMPTLPRKKRIRRGTPREEEVNDLDILAALAEPAQKFLIPR